MIEEIYNKGMWTSAINSLMGTKVKANKQLLKDAIISAIRKRIPIKRFGILFSGGIDSTLIALICKILKKNFICYCVGLKDSKDVAYAKEIAEALRLRLKVREFSLDGAELIIRDVTRLLNTNNVVKVGVGCVLYSAIKIAHRDKVCDFFSGLGSEEIFAGYQRHQLAKDVNKECWRGLKSMWERDIERDLKIANKLRANLLLPFLDKDVIKIAMNLPSSVKIGRGYKKLILRQIASDLGLEERFAYRKKTAAQYGSRFDRAILRLAKRNGFKYKRDYLKSFLQ